MRILFLLVLLLPACQPSAPPERSILALGDSIMAWNGRQGIPEALSRALDRPVVDASRSGARLSTDSVLARALGFDITRQVREGPWDWIVLTAGGNDLRGNCEQAGTAALRDAQIGPDLTGTLPTFLAQLRASGSKVAFLGYYDLLESEPAPCEPEFDIINARMAQLAATDPGLIFLDAADVIDRTDRGLYARDLLHPSPRGSAVIGAALARAILAAEGA
ncbi:MAG: SGNH/GDSL hydrolase family protein [Pseudomonadota bacterium]